MKKILLAAAVAVAAASPAAADIAIAPSQAKKPAPFGVVGDDGKVGVDDAAAQRAAKEERESQRAFRTTINAVTRMPDNGALQAKASRLGLRFLNVLWEDTGRFGGSSVGPNISDVTLQVREDLGGDTFRTHLLPVLRAPNFSDRTADVPAEKLWIKVGNQTLGAQTVSVPLDEMLRHIREYVTNPDSIGGTGDLSAARDTHYLVSAQHVFVPMAKKGRVEFNPVIFNYQSYEGHPAVLSLLVTREGTSVAAITNSGGDVAYDGGGQQLFFNNRGQKTMFTAERKSAVKERIESGHAEASDVGALDDGADMLLIVQVPLKVLAPRGGDSIGGLGGIGYGSGGGGLMAPASAAKGAPMAEGEAERRSRSDVEQAVLGHGKDLGAVDEGKGLKLERDDRFPVRVTVQFYKATSNGVVSDADLTQARDAIEAVYKKADFVGSLVVPEGARSRPTDWYLGTTTNAKKVKTTTTTLPTPPTPPQTEATTNAPTDATTDATTETPAASCAATSLSSSLPAPLALLGLLRLRRLSGLRRRAAGARRV